MTTFRTASFVRASATVVAGLALAALTAPGAPAQGRGAGLQFTEPSPLDFDDHEGYVSIFDGKTLDGWDGNPKFWRVENGAIVGESTPERPSGNSYIAYRRMEAKDFTLKFEIKVEGTGGSGLQYRSRTGLPWLANIPANVAAFNGPVNLNWMMTGPQADFWPSRVYTGQFYSENTPMRILAWRGQVVEGFGDKSKRLMGTIGDREALGTIVKQGDWNQYTVIARGGVFLHIVNGQLLSVMIDDDPASSNNWSGQFGIEIEATTKVSVRNIWVKTQETAGQGRGGRGGSPVPQFVSPEVGADRKITFRVYAPQADTVRLTASDIPGVGQNAQLTRGESGVWELTFGPVNPGTYRYNLNVNGVATIDPRNPSVSESNNNAWSLVHVPGSELFDARDVAHGAVAEVTYNSTALGRFRRMHVYTPPGYESSRERYPVFYLLHGAGDSDDSWSTVGRAGFIFDNLIATRRARPMIVVMPAGHAARAGDNVIGQAATDQFVNDFVTDLMPHVEKHYRVLTDRPNTAIAGLSMGGGQTLQVAIPRLERFAYIGVFSSGLLGAFPGGGRGAPAPGSGAPPAAVEWEKQHAAKLDGAALKRGLRLMWFATGKEDFLMPTTAATVDLFKRHGFAPVFVESPGGHTWINWRNYLAEFAPQLFQTGPRGE